MEPLHAWLADPPRFERQVLDVTGRLSGVDPEREWWSRHTVLRLFTGDPYESRRDGPDRFLANHVLDEPEVVFYLSWGEAEMDAAEIGWETYLRRALVTAVGCAVDQDALFRSGRYTPTRIASRSGDVAATWRDPMGGDVTWHSAGWIHQTMGVVVDIIEAEHGLVGFKAGPLEMHPAEDEDPDCPACTGTALYVPHSPASVIDLLCADHDEAFDEGFAMRMPRLRGEIKEAMGKILYSALDAPVPAVLPVRFDAVEGRPAADQLATFHEIAGWYQGRETDLDALADENDYVMNWLGLLFDRVGEEMGIEAAESLMAEQRRLTPGRCWGSTPTCWACTPGTAPTTGSNASSGTSTRPI